MAETTKVKMITRIAGPELSASPGDEVDVSCELAKALVAGGFATWVCEPTPAPEPVPEPDPEPELVIETAMEAPPEETATLPEPEAKKPRRRVKKPK